MSEADLEVVQEWYRRHPPDLAKAYRDPAFLTRARPILEGLLHPEFVFHAGESDVTGLHGNYQGADAFIDFLQEWFSAFEMFTQEPEEFIAAGEGRVVVLGHERGQPRSASGEVTGEFGDVFHIRDGLITRIDAYQHWQSARRAAGLD
jgi:uncharacterized protein